MNALQLTSRGVTAITLAFLVALMTGCPDSALEIGQATSVADVNRELPGGQRQFGDVAAGDGVTAAQKHRAEQITSVFENDTIELQYAYIENINDGRGYTAGRAGFTTATGDLIVVVERYVEVVPESEFVPFLPRLVTLAETESDSVDGLSGLPEAWARAAKDPRFLSVQDAVVDEMYYQPVVRHWQELGLKTALSQAALYDANIQHGDGPDPDGLSAMIQRATARAGGSPVNGVDEAAWLSAFLTVRRATLSNAFAPATREAWALGADRPEIYETLLADGNLDLTGPIIMETKDHSAVIP